MRRLPLLLVLTLGAFGPTALADVTGASMSDLEELEKQKDWRDLVNRAPDVPPAQRDARWEKLVEEGAVGLLTRLKADEDEDPLGPMALGDSLRDDFPFLKRSDAFGNKRAEIGLKGLDLCHASFCKESEDKWRQKVLDFSRSDPEHVALGGGKLVMKHQPPEQALQEFELAVGEKKKAPACADPDLATSVIAALSTGHLPDEAAKVAGDLCFDAMKPRLLAAFDKDPGDFRKNACPFLTAHKALSKAQAPKCK